MGATLQVIVNTLEVTLPGDNELLKSESSCGRISWNSCWQTPLYELEKLHQTFPEQENLHIPWKCVDFSPSCCSQPGTGIPGVKSRGNPSLRAPTNPFLAKSGLKPQEKPFHPKPWSLGTAELISDLDSCSLWHWSCWNAGKGPQGARNRSRMDRATPALSHGKN